MCSNHNCQGLELERWNAQLQFVTGTPRQRTHVQFGTWQTLT